MLHLCFSAGLRVSELVGLQLQALELSPTPNVRVQGKELDAMNAVVPPALKKGHFRAPDKLIASLRGA